MLQDVPATIKECAEMLQSYVGERAPEVYEMKLIQRTVAAADQVTTDVVALHRIAGTLQNIVDNVDSVGNMDAKVPMHPETQAEWYLRHTMISVRAALKALNAIVPPPEQGD